MLDTTFSKKPRKEPARPWRNMDLLQDKTVKTTTTAIVGPMVVVVEGGKIDQQQVLSQFP